MLGLGREQLRLGYLVFGKFKQHVNVVACEVALGGGDSHAAPGPLT